MKSGKRKSGCPVTGSFHIPGGLKCGDGDRTAIGERAGMERQQLINLIISTTEDYLMTMEGQTNGYPIDAGSRLFGKAGILDSLGLVTVILDVEQRLAEEFGIAIALADDRAMSQKRSPFRTIGSLADYAFLLVNEAQGSMP
jgi:acyl carrier protein